MTISDMLKFLIIDKKMKQVEISKDTGVSISTISRGFKGKFIPNYKNGKAIEALYNEVVANQKAS